jgi:hypothetical protein
MEKTIEAKSEVIIYREGYISKLQENKKLEKR